MAKKDLVPFKKGEDARRNKNGRPVGSFSLTRAVKEYLLEQSKDGETYGEKLKKAAVLRAIGKSDVLMREIWDRTDGKVVQDTNLNVTMPTPLLDNIRKDAKNTDRDERGVLENSGEQA